MLVLELQPEEQASDLTHTWRFVGALRTETGGCHLNNMSSALLQLVGTIFSLQCAISWRGLLHMAVAQKMPLDHLALALVAIPHWLIKKPKLRKIVTCQGLRVSHGHWWELGQPTLGAHLLMVNTVISERP